MGERKNDPLEKLQKVYNFWGHGYKATGFEFPTVAIYDALYLVILDLKQQHEAVFFQDDIKDILKKCGFVVKKQGYIHYKAIRQVISMITKGELIDSLCDKLAENIETLSYTRPNSVQYHKLLRKIVDITEKIRIYEECSYDLDDIIPDYLICDCYFS